ncbi:MAG TPA: hypothetical protein VL527_18040 [Dongiaceae bacterium]|nr:hypothetical protein [Dongiaceae bacterium]
MKIYTPILTGAALLLLSAAASFGAVKVTTEHIGKDDATTQFKFKNIPGPSTNDVATKARFAVVSGEQDGNGSDISVLNDGLLPSGEDEPYENFFFSTDTDTGRFLVDLGSAITIKQVNTYSWHSGPRGPQVYKLYASDGTATGFKARPEAGVNPETVGWKLVASVDTRPKDEDDFGGQYGASIADPDGALGQYRYLLFECSKTETDDDFGNTFYSEVDVVSADAPASTGAAKEVLLTAYFNTVGISKDDSEFDDGVDDQGYCLSATLLGSSQTWSGTPFLIGPATGSNVVTAAGQTIALPEGKFASLKMLAIAVNGNQEAQDFTVTYADGSTQKVTQSLSDWFTPGSFPNEGDVLSMDYRNKSDGTKEDQTFHLYGYTISLTGTNAVKSFTLPTNADVKVFALTVTP